MEWLNFLIQPAASFSGQASTFHALSAILERLAPGKLIIMITVDAC